MAVDTSIYSNLLARPKTVAEFDAEAVQGQSNRLALQMNQAKMGEYQRGIEQENALAGAYKSAAGEDGTIDRNKLITGMAQSGLGAKISGVQKGFADQDKALLESHKAKLENGLKQYEAMTQLMSGVKDQASYDAARQQAAAIMGPEMAANIPPVYDPAAVEAGRIKALSVKDQMEQHWKDIDAKLNADKFGETVRNNKAVVDETARGHTLTAASSRYSADKSAATAGARLTFDKEQAKAGDDPQSAADIEKTAQGIAAHRIAPLSSVAMLRPSGAKIMGRVLDINPTYDAGDFLAKNKALRDFATGPQGTAIQAANTGLNHLDTIEELAKAQKNGNIKMFNQIANRLAAETGQAAPTNLAAAITMVAPEVSKAVIGASGGQEERATFAKNFNPNGSPDQTLGGIGVIKDLMGGRMTEAQRTYERTTNRKDFRDAMLSPAAQRVLDRAHGGSGTPGSSKVIDFGSLK